jgi:hypothetical protein
MQHKLSNIDFESKHLALDAFDITVWLGGQNVEVTGTMEPEISGVCCSNHRDDMNNVHTKSFGFKIYVNTPT